MKPKRRPAKPKYYQKARKWFFAGKEKPKGFTRARINLKENILEIIIGERVIKTVWFN